MKKILAFGASTSSTSINKQLAGYAASQLAGVAYEVIDLNDFEVPVYSEDLEKREAYPAGAEAFNKELDKYDGFIVSLAEHNGSYTAAFKNLFDWASRKDRMVFRNKPTLVLATSPGARGGATVLAAGTATFPHLGAEIVGSYSLPSFYDNFKDGELVELSKKDDLQKLVSELESAILSEVE
jgi:NAD(P)H-dependent FMN reductase